MAARHISPLLNWIGEPMSTIVINSYRQAAAANWYDGAYAAWQAKGAASLADSYIDLTGNGRDLTEVLAPTWASATGWGFNADAILKNDALGVLLAGSDIPFAVLARLTLSTATQVSYVATPNNLANFRQYSGLQINNGTYRHFRRDDTSASVTTTANSAVATSDMVIGFVFNGTSTTFYKDGAADGTFVQNVGIATFNTFAIGGQLAGAVTPSLKCQLSAIGVWATLDAAAVATISAQMAAL